MLFFEGECNFSLFYISHGQLQYLVISPPSLGQCSSHPEDAGLFISQTQTSLARVRHKIIFEEENMMK